MSVHLYLQTQTYRLDWVADLVCNVAEQVGVSDPDVWAEVRDYIGRPPVSPRDFVRPVGEPSVRVAYIVRRGDGYAFRRRSLAEGDDAVLGIQLRIVRHPYEVATEADLVMWSI